MVINRPSLQAKTNCSYVLNMLGTPTLLCSPGFTTHAGLNAKLPFIMIRLTLRALGGCIFLVEVFSWIRTILYCGSTNVPSLLRITIWASSKYGRIPEFSRSPSVSIDASSSGMLPSSVIR